ncbi:chlorophyll a-b binding protein 6, chloroplastic-like [Vigna umbellata]|uniref:chlorophyll a-b binding protein 6, chloroplastic-like n=1 Tax=Vigna umbellata TaxID=87088 RepID=UPI001F5F15C3|nr:chlorophyll a-b binding protein 6, chloroplastic-like [Vigna umbellata]
MTRSGENGGPSKKALPNYHKPLLIGNWVKAQEWAAVPGSQATYLGNPVPRGTLPTIMVIELLAISFVEQQRSMEKDPEKKKYPGGAFDPLGYSRVPKAFQNLKGSEEKGKYSFG